MLLDPDLRPQREAVIARSGPCRPDGFPAGLTGLSGLAGYGRGRLRLAGLVLIPAAAGIAIVLYFTLGRDGPGPRPLVPPAAAPSPPTVAAVRPSVPAADRLAVPGPARASRAAAAARAHAVVGPDAAADAISAPFLVRDDPGVLAPAKLCAAHHRATALGDADAVTDSPAVAESEPDAFPDRRGLTGAEAGGAALGPAGKLAKVWYFRYLRVGPA